MIGKFLRFSELFHSPLPLTELWDVNQSAQGVAMIVAFAEALSRLSEKNGDADSLSAMAAYWTERVLGRIRESDRDTRLALNASGAAAIHRLTVLFRKQAVRAVEILPRIAVLEHLSRVPGLPAIAKQIELSVTTVRIYLGRAQKS